MNAVITFLVGTRVVCTCGYKSPVRYVDDALEKQVRHAYEMGHAFSRATEENVSHGTAHYKEIGEERWKAEGHQWSHEDIRVDLEGWNELHRRGRTKET